MIMLAYDAYMLAQYEDKLEHARIIQPHAQVNLSDSDDDQDLEDDDDEEEEEEQGGPKTGNKPSGGKEEVPEEEEVKHTSIT